MEKITEDLKNTLATHPHIDTIYFDAAGNHYFHAHECNKKMYHRYDIVRTISGYKGSDPIIKTEKRPKPGDEVFAMSREEVLGESTKKGKGKEKENKAE